MSRLLVVKTVRGPENKDQKLGKKIGELGLIVFSGRWWFTPEKEEWRI